MSLSIQSSLDYSKTYAIVAITKAAAATTPAVGRQNVMQHLVSDIADHDVDTPVKLHQDVQLYASEVDAGKAVNFDCAMDVTGAHATAERLVQHDAANISGPNKLTFTASQ
eukprot:gene14848-30130_t